MKNTNNMYKSITKIIIFIIVATILTSIIILLDYSHVQHCKEDNCIRCEIIDNSYKLIKILSCTIVSFKFIKLVKYISYIYVNEENKCKGITLIEQKVQFNE